MFVCCRKFWSNFVTTSLTTSHRVFRALSSFHSFPVFDDWWRASNKTRNFFIVITSISATKKFAARALLSWIPSERLETLDPRTRHRFELHASDPHGDDGMSSSEFYDFGFRYESAESLGSCVSPISPSVSSSSSPRIRRKMRTSETLKFDFRSNFYRVSSVITMHQLCIRARPLQQKIIQPISFITVSASVVESSKRWVHWFDGYINSRSLFFASVESSHIVRQRRLSRVVQMDTVTLTSLMQ